MIFKKKLAIFFFTVLSPISAPVAGLAACFNDSECSYNQVCECPSGSATGNCSSPGMCVPDGRDNIREEFESALQAYLSEQNVNNDKALFGCHTKCEIVEGGISCKIKC